MVSDVAVEEEAGRNLKPSRRRSNEEIDVVVAPINALGRAVRPANSQTSLYVTGRYVGSGSDVTDSPLDTRLETCFEGEI
jgi:hypothetical protein